MGVTLINSESRTTPLRSTRCKSRFTFVFFEAKKVNPMEPLGAKEDVGTDSLLRKKQNARIHCDLQREIHFHSEHGVKSESSVVSVQSSSGCARRFTFWDENTQKVNLATQDQFDCKLLTEDSLFTKFPVPVSHPFASRRFAFAPLTTVGGKRVTKVNRRRDGADYEKNQTEGGQGPKKAQTRTKGALEGGSFDSVRPCANRRRLASGLSRREEL